MLLASLCVFRAGPAQPLPVSCHCPLPFLSSNPPGHMFWRLLSPESSPPSNIPTKRQGPPSRRKPPGDRGRDRGEKEAEDPSGSGWGGTERRVPTALPA